MSKTYVGFGTMVHNTEIPEHVAPYVGPNAIKGSRIVLNTEQSTFFVGHIVAEGEIVPLTKFGQNSITINATRLAGESYYTSLYKLLMEINPNLRPSEVLLDWLVWTW